MKGWSFILGSLKSHLCVISNNFKVCGISVWRRCSREANGKNNVVLQGLPEQAIRLVESDAGSAPAEFQDPGTPREVTSE